MPVYNVAPKWLDLAIKSLERQWYENWELCIVDDCSTNKRTIEYLKTIINSKIKIKFLRKNINISGASNEALKLAKGQYIALMDNDDELTPDALYEVVKCINKNDAEFIYSDEDKLEMNGSFSTPHFKPDFAPDMILSQNYISHLGVIRKDLIDKVGGFEIALEGSQDYDLYLKVFEHTDKICHIPKVLYHWRKVPGSTASEFSGKSYAQEAGRKSLENAMKRRKIDAKVLNGKYPGTYKVEYPIKNNPLVSIIIPFKDKPELLRMCIESILNKSTYSNFEIIGISNNSEEKEIFDEMKRLKNLDKRVQFYEYNVSFNYSEINNYAIKNYAKGEQVILLNNDIEIITSKWIEEMLMYSQRDNVGVVGAKLYYPNNTIQHAGVIIGIGGVAGHAHKYFDKNDTGYFARLNLVQNFSAVTAACLMVKKSIYEEVHGLNEKHLKIAFNDVDFCLRVQEKGYNNIFTPYCEAYHHESISRGSENTKKKKDRFRNEVLYMKRRHRLILKNGDPYYNPNLTLAREDFSLQ
jgi:GT2 family glycosyltransferase